MYQLRDHQQKVEAIQRRLQNERQQFTHSAETALSKVATSTLKSGLSLALRIGAKRIGSKLARRNERRQLIACTQKKHSKRRIALIATISAGVLISQLLELKKRSRENL
jgi:hypothetical protein